MVTQRDWSIKIIESPEDMSAVEQLQRHVWPGIEIDVVPAHILIASIHNGGLLIGAYIEEELVGFVFGFPGFYVTPDGPRPKHHSHMLGVHPDYRRKGLGFALKRAQWQMVRNQGLDRITWTYDPLMGINARLNIFRLGTVCNTYYADFYGEMRDGLNIGLPSDRFQVDWWVNTKRVFRRLSRKLRGGLDLEHYLSANVRIINPSQVDSDGIPHPTMYLHHQKSLSTVERRWDIDMIELKELRESEALLLVEIPGDFTSLKSNHPDLALEWRLHTREIFIDLFDMGYLATDYIFVPGVQPKGYYVLTFGESTL
jgi:predicted GNAT superfamily acetyltransferase